MNQNSVGNRMKELREQAKLRQNQVAAYLGVDQSYLSKIEAGERSISVELHGCALEVFDNPEIQVNPIQIALRARDITVDDMNIIAAINHVASNSRYMANLLKGEA